MKWDAATGGAHATVTIDNPPEVEGEWSDEESVEDHVGEIADHMYNQEGEDPADQLLG